MYWIKAVIKSELDKKHLYQYEFFYYDIEGHRMITKDVFCHNIEDFLIYYENTKSI